MKSRRTFLLSVLSVIAIVFSFTIACLPAPAVNAAAAASIQAGYGITPYPVPTPTRPPQPTPPANKTPTPTPTIPMLPAPTPKPIAFKGVGISQSSFPQGSNATVYGRVENVQSTVKLKVYLKRYYNSYAASTIASYSDTLGANSSNIVYLQNSSIFKYSLNLKSRPAGHYQLVIEATSNGKTISTSFGFYIT